MNYIWFFIILISFAAAAYTGRIDETVNAIWKGAQTSIEIALYLAGIMAFWLGIMRIAEKSGLIKIISKLIKPLAKILFKDVKEDNPAVGNIAMSLTANALGLTNAATPIGLKVMQELQEDNPHKDKATDSMCMFLGMNTAGFQIIPATVIAILAGAGAKNPTDIILPTLIVTTISFIVTIISALILKKLWRKYD